MTPEQEQSIRHQCETAEWVASSDVRLLLKMIDAARAHCTLLYDHHDYGTCMAGSDIGDTLGLHLNE